MNAVNRAWTMAAEYRVRVPKGIAVPFGIDLPEGMEWRVSDDIWRELQTITARYGCDVPIYPEGARLLGVPIAVQDDLPPKSMMLVESADDRRSPHV